MADASTLCRFTSIPTFRPYTRSREGEALPLNCLPAPSSTSSPASSRLPRPSARISRCCAKDRDDGGILGGDDVYGFYPWDPRSSSGGAEEIQWLQEDRVTLFTSEGLIQIGGSLVPRRTSSSDGLCLGALFDIAATNGLDTGRRLCIFGFCRSIEMLSDVVEDAVLEHGGEVVAAEKASEGGLNEKLTMIVAVPLLWGVPPASETLHFAVKSGGGIVEKVYWQWDFM